MPQQNPIMSHTIPASSITIDGDRAWLIAPPWPDGDPLKSWWVWQDHPCMTCKGTNLYHNGMGADACPDCADGRHTFEIDVEDLEAAPIYIGHGMTTTYRVHVVRVLPIVTWYAGGDMPWPCFEMEPDVEVVQRWQRPADAAPGKYAVELAVHS
jgi:hypothetical protein